MRPARGDASAGKVGMANDIYGAEAAGAAHRHMRSNALQLLAHAAARAKRAVAAAN